MTASPIQSRTQGALTDTREQARSAVETRRRYTFGARTSCALRPEKAGRKVVAAHFEGERTTPGKWSRAATARRVEMGGFSRGAAR